MSGANDTVEEDGRHVRSTRSRDKVVRAMIALVRRTTEEPTADAVAELAGLSRRTFFRHFSDLESLHVAANEHMAAEVMSRFPPPMPAEERAEETIRRVVDHRTSVYAHIFPLRQMAERLRHQHTFVARSLDASDAQFRMHARIMFAQHLADELSERWVSVELMTSWYAYRALCGPLLQTPSQAKVVMVNNLGRVLDGALR